MSAKKKEMSRKKKINERQPRPRDHTRARKKPPQTDHNNKISRKQTKVGYGFTEDPPKFLKMPTVTPTKKVTKSQNIADEKMTKKCTKETILCKGEATATTRPYPGSQKSALTFIVYSLSPPL